MEVSKGALFLIKFLRASMAELCPSKPSIGNGMV
jgi:hypothetical protein